MPLAVVKDVIDGRVLRRIGRPSRNPNTRERVENRKSTAVELATPCVLYLRLSQLYRSIRLGESQGTPARTRGALLRIDCIRIVKERYFGDRRSRAGRRRVRQRRPLGQVSRFWDASRGVRLFRTVNLGAIGTTPVGFVWQNFSVVFCPSGSVRKSFVVSGFGFQVAEAVRAEVVGARGFCLLGHRLGCA
jgi:hypothetical protein